MKNRPSREEGLPKTGGRSQAAVKSRQTRETRNAVEDRSSRTDRNELQTSTKIGLESGSQKERKLRFKTEAAPATTPVPGAFGKTGSLSEPEDEMIHPDDDVENERRDFIAERHRQNRRARK